MTEAAALASARSAYLPPNPDRDPCECAGCYERRHADAERRTWRELDDARRTAVPAPRSAADGATVPGDAR